MNPKSNMEDEPREVVMDATIELDDAPFSSVGVKGDGDLSDEVQSPVVSHVYPSSIKYIMGNETCERFSFYGLRGILELYLVNDLLFTDNQATMTLHAFVFCCYFLTVPFGYLADVYLGKYRVIILTSLVYCMGSSTLALSAIPPSVLGTIAGLLMISVGTGGIKACLSAFVGDQFVKGQEVLLAQAFGLFYFCTNLGSLVSTFVTPVLREDLNAATAFALPAFLLLIATGIFWWGRKSYTVAPPGGSVISDFSRVFRDACRAWWARSSSAAASSEEDMEEGDEETKDESLGPFWRGALAHHPRQLVVDMRDTVSILKVFLFLPIFWSLFDQHGSRWVLQAEMMNRSFYFFELTGDQIPVLNPFFTLSMIPVFQLVLYPFVERVLGAPLKPLEHKMVYGMTLAGLSFLLSALLQMVIDQSAPHSVHVISQIPQFFFLSCGEIMVSVTGLEVAYSEAPITMKSLLMSGWSMTIAVGNLFVALIAALDWPKGLLANFFLFAALMFLFNLLFYWYTRGYQYRDPNTNMNAKEAFSVQTEEKSTSGDAYELEEFEEDGEVELEAEGTPSQTNPSPPLAHDKND